jgi:prophage regulatory protein
MERAMSTPKKFLRLQAVMDAVGLARATIYKRIKEGTFPAPVQLGPRAVAWDESAIAEWQAGLQTGVKKDLV